MKKIILFFSFFIFIGPSESQSSALLQRKVKELENQIIVLSQQIATLTQQLSQKTNEVATLTQKIVVLEKELKEEKEKTNELIKEIAIQNSKINSLSKKVQSSVDQKRPFLSPAEKQKLYQEYREKHLKKRDNSGTQ